MEPILLTDRQGSVLLGLSRATFWRRVNDTTLPAPIKIGGATRWRRDEILAAVEAATRSRDLGGA